LESTHALPKEKTVEMYRKMQLIRTFENHVKRLYSEGKIPGDVHLCSGEEAVAVGVASTLRDGDYVVSPHRSHGHCIAKGANVKSMMAELLGKSTGYCQGKGGSMHVADFSIGMLGAYPVVGAGIPIAVGAGLSSKMRNSGQVAVSFFGDGASNQGTFHESLNLASIWKLPVVFVCENNQYAESTSVKDVVPTENIADRAGAYRIPGAVVDGMDVFQVHTKSAEAVERARQGSGPTLLECKTYRFEGHNIGEPWTTYRTREETESWMKKCPIAKLRRNLISEATMTSTELDRIDAECEQLVLDAIEFATNSPTPDPSTAFVDIYANPLTKGG